MGFRKMLTKVTIEAALNAELDKLLGYAQHAEVEVTPLLISPTVNFDIFKTLHLFLSNKSGALMLLTSV
ncbi:hypothetical protein CWB96_22150 [Pseudoalteromonas citrea]|uniref:Uncharacterized protein n=1 Tax=Pseudoalteromonas citrea TaxID=43655 RepID=A0A5S3XGC2_9GAMM|nr:hypothetical protein [Pseudoalteromonas citrea]TMP44015.1 hypothetical protein CWB97_07500 [Pseudoalteromonas citrea]TMP51826.1 hypothetical protein CWB96_22150 [Pseudoalteromonas citrea]